MTYLRLFIVLAATALLGGLFSRQILSLNKIKEDGRIIYLDLQPVDPRALMMGDYMRLGYAEENVPEGMDIDDLPPKGAFVMKLDENRVASYLRLNTDTPLAGDEVLLNYTRTHRNLTFGAPRFYFENGRAEVYEPARYGVFKTSETGQAILVNLADEKFEILRSGRRSK